MLVTMAAGLSIAAIRQMAGADWPVIRIMPNTPASIGEGMILYCAEGATEEEVSAFTDLMQGAGSLDPLPGGLIDAGSAVSGCGPAFVYPLSRPWPTGRWPAGCPGIRPSTMPPRPWWGAAKLVLESGSHPGALKDAVCSPGGSTIQGGAGPGRAVSPRGHGGGHRRLPEDAGSGQAVNEKKTVSCGARRERNANSHENCRQSGHLHPGLCHRRLNIRQRWKSCAKVLSDLKNAGHEIILVSSGAIGMGVGKLSLSGRPSDMPGKQAAAAVGQCELMYTYDKLFAEYSHVVAQILLTGEDLEHQDRKENFQNTLYRLLELGALPIVNENDTIATKEIAVGDNDSLGGHCGRLLQGGSAGGAQRY